MTIENQRWMCDYDKTHRWVITTLVALLCFSLGYGASTTQLRDTVVRNTARIDKLEQVMDTINQKLDTILLRTQ
jgi:hypothetical protein